VTGGKVYITGPYKGAPYGLSIVVPSKAGPYTLAGTTGNGTVVVRSTINVNPETAALTVTSDPLPTKLDGIPLQLRLVNVTINRPEFIFNSTSCNKMAIGATLTDTQATGVNTNSSYQVTNCQALKFQPKFSVSTAGKTSKALGASLDVKLSYPAGSAGKQANVKRVKVELPQALPSQLKTLQKACTAKQFDSNPAGCPPESDIGFAVVHTPLLPVPLEGPAYFVSNGSEAFPNLIMVLQGYGVTVHLVGDTDIKNGITSSTFATTPDVPFESFELYLPQGKYSALAANGNLCKPTVTKTVKKKVRVKVGGKTETLTRKLKQQVAKPLLMPTEFIAQNGDPIHQNTPIKVTGCPTTTKAKAAAKKATGQKK
jgi:hypothetical protein